MKIQFGRRFWIVATAVIVVFTVFVVGRNALHAVKTTIAAVAAIQNLRPN